MTFEIHPKVIGVRLLEATVDACDRRIYGITLGNSLRCAMNTGSWEGYGGIFLRYRLHGPEVLDIQAQLEVASNRRALHSPQGIVLNSNDVHSVFRYISPLVFQVGPVDDLQLSCKLKEILDII